MKLQHPSVTTRDRLLQSLRRDGPQTVAELADRFSLSPMALRLHLGRLQGEGLVEARRKRPSRGRPARIFALTQAACRLFPQRSGELALEVLEQVEIEAGREVVVRALERRARQLVTEYRRRLDGTVGLERLRALSALRDGEGYVCDVLPSSNASRRTNGSPGSTAAGPTPVLPDLVERHCPVADVAAHWPEVCRIESQVLSEALGVPVERTEHLMGGGTCCRYSVLNLDGVVPSRGAESSGRPV